MENIKWIPIPLSFLGDALPFTVKDDDSRLYKGIDFVVLSSANNRRRDMVHGVYYDTPDGRVAEYHPVDISMTHYCIINAVALKD